MRTAYSGRAAAYEKKGDFQSALADHKMTVLFYAIEAEILNGTDSPAHAKFLVDAAGAYRARGKCLEVLGQSTPAAVDRKRAEDLEAAAKKLEPPAPTPVQNSATVRVRNAWNQSVKLVIGGTTHVLEVGTEKVIPTPPGAVPYEMEMGTNRSAGTLQAGKTYTIQ